MNKKINKLFKNPKLFFKDMYLKRSLQLKSLLPVKKNHGNNSFTVITAVYNVEKYLDQYFRSLTKQSLDFVQNITLILVDDGSSDSSAIIIKKWQAKYPNNIHYFYKENGGQASARNLGIQYATGDWLTFIDPDDFISIDYFLKVDNVLKTEQDVSILVTPIAVYKEDKNTYHYDTTPLTYCFKDKDKKIPIKKLKNKIQLSVCTAFFRTKIIKNSNLLFDEKVKPCFEDGRFVTDYLIISNNCNAYFLDNVYYFYRVRKDNSSTTNTQWEKKEKYIDVFEYGYLEMFAKYRDIYGHIPLNIQMTFLFFAIQYIKLIVQKGEQAISFLSLKEKENFLSLFYECFKFIDKSTIMQFHLHGCNFFYKHGMLSTFKDESPNFLMVYFENIDYQKNLLELYFYSIDDSQIDYFIDDNYTIPVLRKIREYKFLNNTFINEYRVWIHLEPYSQKLELKSPLPLKIVYNKQEYLNKFPLNIVQNEFDKPLNQGPWLLIDKETKADDNAEHLYRYISMYYPKQEIYFVLSRSSPDWKRLALEKFNLLEFGSKKFEEKLKLSSALFSSQADKYFMNYFGKDTLKGKKFIFLQHGVIMHDLSTWLNNVSKISLFCTSTLPEYNFISNINSPYKYSHEVKLTGLARHDSLLEKSKKYTKTKNILIMPTWRNYIVGALKQGSVQREINPNFVETDYFKYWYAFLHSKELRIVSERYGYSITFIPHPNISDYLSLFKIPDYIESPSNTKNISINDSVAKAKIMITDYSSISFDMAFLHKLTLYYQFDENEFFSGNHTSKQGYFSYREDGFGPIVKTQEELLNTLSFYLKNNCTLLEPYASRIKHTYTQSDGKNCERIYQAVMHLEQAYEKDFNFDILNTMIIQSKNSQKWDNLIKKSQFMLDNAEKKANLKIKKEVYQNYIATALFQQNKFVDLFNFLNENKLKKKEYWLAQIDLQLTPKKGLDYFIKKLPKEKIILLNCLLASARLNNYSYAKIIKSRLNLKYKNLEIHEQEILSIVEVALSRNRFSATLKIASYLKFLPINLKKIYKLELLMAQIYLENNLLQKAHEALVDYEKHTRNDPACRLLIAILADKYANYEKVIYQINQAFTENLIYAPEFVCKIYFTALEKNKQMEANHMLLKS